MATIETTGKYPVTKTAYSRMVFAAVIEIRKSAKEAKEVITLEAAYTEAKALVADFYIKEEK